MAIGPNRLAQLKKKMKKNPNIPNIAAARASGKATAPGQLKKQAGVQSARQFTPAGPHRNLPMVPKSAPSNPLNPRMAPRLPVAGGSKVNMGNGNPLPGNRSAAAATKYGFDILKVQRAAKKKLNK